MHSVQCAEQFQAYVNRFGPGMVVYWFGFVRELLDEPEADTVHLVDGFPGEDRIVRFEDAG